LIKGYIRTRTVSEAIETLENNRPWGRILAGGTDILSGIKAVRSAKSSPRVLVDVKRIHYLRGIRKQSGWLVIGSVTTLYELATSGLVQDLFPVLAQAAGKIGSAELRNLGTVGGNVGTKSTAADLLAPLTGLGARAEIHDETGPRYVSFQELLTKEWHKLGRRSILTTIQIPIIPAVKWGYCRWTRESMGRPYIVALAGLERQGDEESYLFTAVLGGAGLWPRAAATKIPAADLFRPGSVADVADRAAEEILSVSRKKGEDYRTAAARSALGEALEAACIQVG